MTTLAQIKGVIPYLATTTSTQVGCNRVILPDGSIASCQPDGSIETRPPDQDGPYEQGQVTGTIILYAPQGAAGPIWAFGLAKGDKLPQ